jgi:hypothetical protein
LSPFAIEVKSTLTLGDLRTAHDSASELMPFRYAPGIDDSPILREHDNVEAAVSGLIAFDSDLALSGKSELQRYQEQVGSDSPALRMLCVVGRGYWSYAHDKWESWEIGSPGGEVACFVTGIIHTYLTRACSLRRRCA